MSTYPWKNEAEKAFADKHAGTVSWGTHRQPDLLRAFAEKLIEFEPENEHLIGEARAFAAMMERETIHPRTFDDASHVLESLINALNEHAPEGWYFGTHPGDGSDFGFWVSEEDD